MTPLTVHLFITPLTFFPILHSRNAFKGALFLLQDYERRIYFTFYQFHHGSTVALGGLVDLKLPVEFRRISASARRALAFLFSLRYTSFPKRMRELSQENARALPGMKVF